MVTNGITYGASQLTSESVSYTKNGQIITVKKALDDLINMSLTKIDDLEEQVNNYKKLTVYLYDKVDIGDYVAYDAGEWKEDKEKPKLQGEFGGYTKGKSKNESVACWEETAPKYNGWRVLSKDDATRTVTLVHAGAPECYYHSGSDSSYPKASVDALNERGNQYVNDAYATKGRSLNKEDVENFEISNSLRKTDTRYWLATDFGSYFVYHIFADGSLINSGRDSQGGFRPVVELKPGILTTGQGPDKVGNKDAWTLVAQD